MSELEQRKFLDQEGLRVLWEQIKSKFTDNVSFEDFKDLVEDDYLKKTDASALYVEKQNGKAFIFNEVDGGGAQYRGDAGTSFVGVNDGIESEDGIAAQIYAINKQNTGTKLDVTRNGIYYTAGAESGKPAAERDIPENEVATMGDIAAAMKGGINYKGMTTAQEGETPKQAADRYDPDAKQGDMVIVNDAEGAHVMIFSESANAWEEAGDASIYATKAELDKDVAKLEREKLDILPLVDDPDDPGYGWDYHIPYNIEFTPDTDKVVVKNHTITLNNKLTKMTFTKDITAATEEYAGLMSAGDKKALLNKTDYHVEGDNGTAYMFNERDGGGAKFVNKDGLESFVGVNDGGEDGLAAQIYADKLVDGKWQGAKLDVTNGAIYYTVGSDSFAARAIEDNEVATLGDVKAHDPAALTEEEILDILK